MQKKRGRRFKYLVTLLIVFTGVLLLINNSSFFLKLAYPLKYKEHVMRYAEPYGLDPYLVFAVIKAESGFDPQATSHKDARGLMQITDRTGMWLAEELDMEDFSTHMLYDVETNIRIGCWYLKKLKEQFGSEDLAIAAYNGGSGNVTKWLKDKDLSQSGKSLDKIPFKETEEYVKKVQNYHSTYKMLYKNEF